AGSRLIVESSFKEEFLHRLKERFEQLSIGPGLEDPDVGPILNQKQFDHVQQMLQIASREGNIITGGEEVTVAGNEAGLYLQPTIVMVSLLKAGWLKKKYLVLL